MNRLRLAFVTAVLLLAVPAVAAAEELRAGSGPDTVRAGAGADLVAGGDGRDTLHAGRGDDLVVDTDGRDRVQGGKGDDRVNVRDWRPGDRVECGPGDDVVVADEGDVVSDDCETVTTERARALVRKDAARLTARQKRDFVDAVLALKAAPSPYDARLPWYDQFTAWHDTAFSGNPSAHGSAGFLPWHREFLLAFEAALQTVSGKPIALPYWDWTSEASTAAVFSDDLMGGDGDPAAAYAVTSGPFRKGAWRIWARDDGGESPFVPGVDQPVEGRYVERAIGTYGTSLPTSEGVARMLAVPVYDAPGFDGDVAFDGSFRSAIEAGEDDVPAHNQVHVHVGGGFEGPGGFQTGTMGLSTSPNDPVFWLHHNNIDRLWDAWSTLHGDVYLPEAGERPGINVDDLMEPFGVTPRRLLQRAALGYRYDTSADGRKLRVSDLVCVL